MVKEEFGWCHFREKKLCEEIIKPFIRNTGPSISPFNAWLLSKSLDTLELRVNQQNNNTKKIVSFLQAQNTVENLIYPWSKIFLVSLDLPKSR